MNTGIGATLREARNRRKLDLSEVEAATKIRIRYLRAMENDEWDILPGGAYTRGFIRTYASHLGLDGDRVVDEYRQAVEQRGERTTRVEPIGRDRATLSLPRLSRPVQALAVSLALVALLVAIGLLSGDGGSSPAPVSTPKGEAKAPPGKHRPAVSAKPGVAVRLTAKAEIWVCLLDGAGRPLIDGQILDAGAEEGPFRSSGFSVSFGNGEVTLLVDGADAEVPVTSSPIGYEIDGSGGLTRLSEAERPTCA